MRRAPVLLTAVAAAVAIAGCGGSSSSSSSSTSTAAKPTAPATTSTAAASPAPTAKAGATMVSVKNFDFAPHALKVKVGAKVTWKNGDATNHTVTFKTAGAPSSVDNLAQGASVSRTFPKAGTYSYVCTFHPNMKATVVVSK